MKKHYTFITLLVASIILITCLQVIPDFVKSTPSKVSNKILPNSLASTPTGGAISSIQEAIAKREYHITYDSARHALQSPNRRHHVRAYYRPGRLSIQNRIDSAGHNFKMELVNKGVYADGKLIATSERSAKTDNQLATLRISHDGFAEEFINNESGVRQNFIIDRAPAGTQQLAVQLLVQGLHASQPSPDRLVFYSQSHGKKTDRLIYSDLRCWDADGKPLVAALSLSGNQIAIRVNVEHAAYPVTIDPIITNGSPANADKTLEINQSYAWLGFSVSTAGDVNGDGYSDVLIGAPKYDNGQSDEGAAFLYPGTATGISLAATVLECNQANAQMGYSVSSAGDINKDGFSDIIIGAPFYDDSGMNEGAVMIYRGSAGGIVVNNPYVFRLDQAEANFGVSVSMAGDVNGDGFSDMLAGAHMFDQGQTNEGVGVLIYGASNGLGMVTFLECNQPGAMMGFAVAGAGDVNGDGFSDVMAGARLYSNGQSLEGAAFVFKGSANGVVLANPAVIEGNQVDARLGHALSSVGDVNGDGYSDIAIGTYLYDKGSNNEGAVMIHLGCPNGINTVASQTLESDQTEAQFGFSVACAGDVNADGYADLLVGARYFDKGQANEGAAFLYEGTPVGLDPTPVSVLESNQADAWLGSAVAPAGDVNGDGFSDVLVGSYAFDNGQKDEGSVFVWFGCETVGKTYKYEILGDLGQNSKGFAYCVSSAGDVNGDGFDDLLIGAKFYDFGSVNEGAAFLYYGSREGVNISNFITLRKGQTNSRMGSSVSGAGDINGDGYADFIVGAVLFDCLQNDTGAAFVYYGSPNGVDVATSATLANNIPGSNFGYAVSTAGDVNGDGYSDIAVSANYFANGSGPKGAVYLYIGSLAGPILSPVKIEGNDYDKLGSSLAAGDFNGDGYSDLVVGKGDLGDLTNDGTVSVYVGSSNGLIVPPALILDCDQIDALFGCKMSCAGDLNGDGYADLAVGAPLYDHGQNNEGAIFLYFGSASGLKSQNASLLEIDQEGACLGVAISSLGDIDGNGYCDLAASASYYDHGEYDEGGIFAFYGCPTTDKITSSLIFEGNQEYGFLGSVGTSGDLNGDGICEIIVGFPNFNVGNKYNVGMVQIVNLSKTIAINNNPRLYNVDLTTPINHNQLPQNNFGAGLFAKSFLGRNKGKLAWETKPSNQGFSKGSNNRITNSTQSTGMQNGYASLGTAGTELKNIIDKQGVGTKVRMRVKYDPALALTGQAYGPWRYLPAYLVGNSNAPVPENVLGNASDIHAEEPLRPRDETTSEKVFIYPNPAVDRMHIHFDDRDHISRIQLITQSGVVKYHTNGFKSSVDLQGLSNGVYYLIMTKTDGSKFTQKVLVSH